MPAPKVVREITWQLVRGIGISSKVIGFEGQEFYSHIDVVTPQGMLRGARSDWIKGIRPGYMDRPQDYEKWDAQTRYTVTVTNRQYADYWEFSDAHLGSPYDERGLIAAFFLGRKHKIRDKRDKWIGWCSQEVALNGEAARIWEIPPEVSNVDPGDCVFLFSGLGAHRQEMIPMRE